MTRRSDLARSVLGLTAGVAVTAELLRDALRAHEDARAFGLGFSVLVGLAALGVRLPRLGPQLTGRAVLLAMGMLGLVASIARPRLEPAVVAALCAVLLATARDPSLRAPETIAQFAPIAYRRTFLVAVVAQGALAFLLTLLAAGALSRAPAWLGLGMLAVAALLCASGHAVLRMRAWGVFASGLTSVALVTLAGCGATLSARVAITILVLSPIPLAMWVPVALARLARTDRL